LGHKGGGEKKDKVPFLGVDDECCRMRRGGQTWAGCAGLPGSRAKKGGRLKVGGGAKGTR